MYEVEATVENHCEDLWLVKVGLPVESGSCSILGSPLLGQGSFLVIDQVQMIPVEGFLRIRVGY